MNNYENIGKLESETRRACGINAKDLCAGICSESMLKKIETDTIFADYLVINRLFSRIGKAINQIALLLSEDDYLEYYYQQNFLYLIQEKNIPKLKELLAEYQQWKPQKSPLQQQYLYIYMAICKILCGEQQKALYILKNAIEMTLPEFSIQKIQYFLLSKDEISMILLWLQQRGLSGDKNAINEVRMLCLELEKRHFDIHVWDIIFPQIVWVWRQLSLFHNQSVEMAEVDLYCEKVFTLLTKEMRLLYLPQFLKIKIDILKNRNDPEKRQREKQRDALQKIYATHGEIYPEDELELWGSCRQQRISIITETLRTERQYRDLIQEEMSELAEIDPKTLSRIETGTNFPKRGTLQKLIKAMDIEQHLYSTEIDVTDFSLLELLEDKKMAYSLNNIAEEIRIFEILKKQIPQNRKNRQYLDYMETDLLNRQGLLSDKDALKRCKCIFEQTRSFEPEKFSNVRLSLTEFNLAILIALLYYKEKRFTEEQHLLENILQGYDSSGVDETFYTGELGLLLAHLASVCGELGDYKQALSYCHRGIRLHLKNGTGFMLAHLQSQLCFLEDDMNSPQEQCIKNYGELYHLLSLWNMERERTLVKNGCEEKYSLNTSSW